MPRAKGDTRPRGRMTAYAFFVQTAREEQKRLHPGGSVVSFNNVFIGFPCMLLSWGGVEGRMELGGSTLDPIKRSQNFPHLLEYGAYDHRALYIRNYAPYIYKRQGCICMKLNNPTHPPLNPKI